ncbi:UNVERIFIED_CONTAM: Vestitone reductase [Sesamum angustifolium]|uniref:Dihydroflavonol 4-reductase n=1 Tax=Sesamum angustifolium TaxID=2727405 RepID=A0AAW2RHW7_9LAMI
MEEDDQLKKGRVCVTGGTGFVASWLIMKLLQLGYSVNTTMRPQSHSSGSKKDISYLKNLPGAQERLQVFPADLENPDSFEAAIEGCIGVFHVAHPIDFVGKETEEMITNKSVRGTLAILEACLKAKTVKRVVYTSSAFTVMFNNDGPDIVVDESSWTDVDYVRNANFVGASYSISKTLTERAALEFAEKHSLDLVSVIPTWINGPFICPNIPGSVTGSLAMILGDKGHYQHLKDSSLVHVDDVARAHIHLLEHPEAKGRYICSAVEFTIEELCEFISTRYPEHQMPTPDSWKDIIPVKFSGFSTKKLQEIGFKYENGLEEMFDGAIKCCKEKGLL